MRPVRNRAKPQRRSARTRCRSARATSKATPISSRPPRQPNTHRPPIGPAQFQLSRFQDFLWTPPRAYAKSAPSSQAVQVHAPGLRGRHEDRSRCSAIACTSRLARHFGNRSRCGFRARTARGTRGSRRIAPSTSGQNRKNRSQVAVSLALTACASCMDATLFKTRLTRGIAKCWSFARPTTHLIRP